MDRLILILVLIVFFVSCNKDKKIIKRYDSGKIESIHYYGSDRTIDSSYLYYPTEEIRQIVYFKEKDTINSTILFDQNRDKYAQGSIVKNNLDYRIGKWHFYNDSETDSIVEYINVNNEPYVNQIWILDKKSKDTVKNKGNFYEIYTKDTIYTIDTLRIRFYLYLPNISYDSDIEVIMPKNDKELKDDFSNIYEVEKDTFYSLKNDGIPHPEIPEEVPVNHNVNFGLIYNEPGKKRIRGYLAEYVEKKNGERIERRLYFDKNIYVKDTL